MTGEGEHRYRVPMSRVLQAAVRRPLSALADQPAAEWPHRGRLDFGRLETLLEQLEEAEVADRSAVFVTRREASTLLAWVQHRHQLARDAEGMGSAEALMARLEFMLGLRADIPGQVPGVPVGVERMATG